MKWYSVKKYRPIDGNTYLIRAIEKDFGEENFIVSTCLDPGKSSDSDGWRYLGCHDDYQITHFSTIEPVGIEE